MIVRFVPRSIAEKMAASPNVAVISIRDPETQIASLQTGWRDVLYLDFFDTDGSDPELKHMSLADAQSIVEFAGKHHDADEILVHCIAGQSRSAGVAEFLREYQNRSLYQYQQPITVDRPYTKYNSYVYKLLREVAYGKYEVGSAFSNLSID